MTAYRYARDNLPMTWIDSHCHLDAPEFAADRDAVRLAARQAGVGTCVIPAVESANFEVVRLLAHQHEDVYALGIHPLYTPPVGSHFSSTHEQSPLTHVHKLTHTHTHMPATADRGTFALV